MWLCFYFPPPWAFHLGPHMPGKCSTPELCSYFEEESKLPQLSLKSLDYIGLDSYLAGSWDCSLHHQTGLLCFSERETCIAQAINLYSARTLMAGELWIWSPWCRVTRPLSFSCLLSFGFWGRVSCSPGCPHILWVVVDACPCLLGAEILSGHCCARECSAGAQMPHMLSLTRPCLVCSILFFSYMSYLWL